MRRAGRWLAFMPLAMASPALGSADELPRVSVCEVDARSDLFVGREVLAEGRLIRTAHGFYTERQECPAIYLMVTVAKDAGPDAIARMHASASNVGQPEATWKPPVLMHARVERNDHTLQGTTEVRKRLMLVVADVEPDASSR